MGSLRDISGRLTEKWFLDRSVGHEGVKEGEKTSRIVTFVGEKTRTLHQRDMSSELATGGGPVQVT